MGSGFISAAIAESQTLSDDEKQHAGSALAALTGWASALPLTDRAKAQQAIAAVTDTARKLALVSIDALRSITLDQALAKAGIVVAGTKKPLEGRSDEHTSELQSLTRICTDVFCFNKKKKQ